MLKKKSIRFTSIMAVFVVLVLLSIGLFIERNGIRYQASNTPSYYLDKSKVKTKEEALAKVAETHLLVYDSSNKTSASAIDNFKQMFEDMKVGTTYLDLAKEKLPDFSGFQSVTILTPDLEPLGEKAVELMDWVERGGNVLFAMTIQKDRISSIIEHKLGIVSSSYNYAVVDEVRLEKDFMIGSQQQYKIDEAFESAWAVELDSKAQVHMTTANKAKVPLIWSYNLERGRVVVDNFGLYVKAMRGFYAASYSLLGEVGVYPVINAASFTLDDFPSPVPSGNAEYVTRDYNMSVSDFYINIWWPNMVSLADKYDLKYTGVVIENYENKTSGQVERQADTSRFTYFGNMLLQMGGEIGYHGYNHQPFSLSNVNYGDEFDYHTWPDTKAVGKSLDELINFTDTLFPAVEKSVYVPPSNILSPEARKFIAEKYPQIKVIASSYFSKSFEYEQEFGVAKDGIIEEPRISSGMIIDDYIRLTMVSELNMHYVSHHFVHPDDPLDEDRGAKMGWEKMFKNLSKQMDWLYKAAPSIRNLTESQMGGAIQRFSSLTVEKEVTDTEITFKLGNFVDEAYLMVRVNEGEIGAVQGGELERLTGNVYLLRATNKKVVIQRK